MDVDLLEVFGRDFFKDYSECRKIISFDIEEIQSTENVQVLLVKFDRLLSQIFFFKTIFLEGNFFC